MVSKYYVRESFYNPLTCELPDEVCFKNKKYNLNQYLHGCCDIFVMKLFELGQKYGIDYPIAIIYNERDGLTHAFCWVESPIEHLDYFIDVRGITCDKDEFFGEFDDYFDYQSYFNVNYEPEDGDIYFCYSIEEYLEFMSKLFKGEEDYYEQEDLLSECEEIINNFQEKYLLPQWIIDELKE